MTGALKRQTSISALLAAGALASVAPVQAADLGGDCCADLEERIAELEATTARKGNRKVSLTVSGQVHQLIMAWDDGVESNVYVADNNNSSTRFRFVGKATISKDWAAGYNLEIEADTARSSLVTQNNDDANAGFVLRQSNWWIESKTYGRLTVGQGSTANDDINLIDVAGSSPGSFADTQLIGGALQFRRGDNSALSGISIAALATTFDAARRNVVRYDSPTFEGAKIVATWGEDDFWDAAIWYAKDFKDFKVAGAIGYLKDTEGNGLGGAAGTTFVNQGFDFESVQGSASVLHIPSGLFVTGAFGHREFEGPGLATALLAGATPGDVDYYYVAAGIVTKLVPLGKTVFYGEYEFEEGALEGFTTGGFAGGITRSEIDVYGFGITQHIDAAAMELYIGYKNYEADVAGRLVVNGAVTTLNTDDIDIAYTGARIKF